MNTSFHNSTVSKKRKTLFLKKVQTYTDSILKKRKEHNYSFSESSLFVAEDTKYQNTIQKALVPFLGVKQVVLVGIGGSNLGTEAVYHALKSPNSPALIVLDSIESDAFVEVEALIKKTRNASDVAFIVISKSGGTTETMVNAQKLLALSVKKFGEADTYARTIFIGDEGTPFFNAGKKKKILCIKMPTIVGGRYSVLTAVGIVPLTLLGIDVASLRKGATSALSPESISHIHESAVTLALEAESGTHTVNFFTFNKRLSLIGYWYRQLLAESIGKTVTNKKKPFEFALLPAVSTSADLHSMSELFLSGYQNMYTHFLSYKEGDTLVSDNSSWILEHLPFLQGKEFESMKDAIKNGVLQAYDDQKLPYRSTELTNCAPQEIGGLLVSLMLEVMCLAHLLDVDPFHQPSVELYKKHTKALLA